ncbi:MAG: glycosyltransferase family 9 protein [Deltaproteobacteria bacterium]|nr:glycosyltransferase family 9 protein [Deltaproteobacteria bacterium]
MGFKTGALKFVDRYIGGLIVRFLGWRNFRKTLGPPFVEIVPDRVKSVLFIRPGGMGDLLLLLPSVRRVKELFPSARLTLVGEQRNRQVADLSVLFDEVLCYDRGPQTFLSKLRDGQFDVAIDAEQFHNSSVIFAYLSGAPVRIGFKISPARNELYTHLVDYPMDRHEAEAFSLLVEPLCGKADAPLPLTGLLDESRLPSSVPGFSEAPGRYVAVFPYGGARGKVWPAGRWAEIVRRLLALNAGRVTLVGGDDSSMIAREVMRSVNDPRVTSFVGRLSLSETAAVVARAKLYVGCDTGVTHLAHAFGTRTVVLFGASDERKWGPPTASGESVSTRVPCRPCSIFGYVKLCRTIDCMDRIGQDQVWQAIERALAG